MNTAKPLILVSGFNNVLVVNELSRLCCLTQVTPYSTNLNFSPDAPKEITIDYETYLSCMMDNSFVSYSQGNGFFYGVTKDQLDKADVYAISRDEAIILSQRYVTDRVVYLISLRQDECGSARGVSRNTSAECASSQTNMAENFFTCKMSLAFKDVDTTVGSILSFTGLKRRT